nr:MAG TPA: Repressor protein CI [Caudoviricetes sp.]DAY36156.1 MAG TPA: Repressor protein CI [Caudoviricetes sp.]
MPYEIKDIVKIIKNKRDELNLSLRDLSSKTGISSSTLQRYETMETNMPIDKFQIICDVLGLEADKLLSNKNYSSQEKSNLNIDTINTDYIMIPLYESISAGYGASNSEFIEMIPVFGLKKNGTTYFAVKVEGDSMEPKIPNGSTIIIKKDIQIESGEIGAFNLNDENFVKQKKVVKDRLILHSFNLAYDDKLVNEYDDFKEYGKVVKVMIDL